MAFTTEQKLVLYKQFIALGQASRDALGDFSKQDLKDAVGAIGDWVDDNTVSLNTAIPEPCRTQLTQKQKFIIFSAVIEAKRGGM